MSVASIRGLERMPSETASNLKSLFSSQRPESTNTTHPIILRSEERKIYRYICKRNEEITQGINVYDTLDTRRYAGGRCTDPTIDASEHDANARD